MRSLQVVPVAFLIVICLFITVMEVNGLKYNMADLKGVVNYQCCVRKDAVIERRREYREKLLTSKRGFEEQNPLKKESEAKMFLTRFMTRGTLHEECCRESCSHEEIREGSFLTSIELGEECLHEGCSIEEIYEHC